MGGTGAVVHTKLEEVKLVALSTLTTTRRKRARGRAERMGTTASIPETTLPTCYYYLRYIYTYLCPM